MAEGEEQEVANQNVQEEREGRAAAIAAAVQNVNPQDLQRFQSAVPFFFFVLLLLLVGIFSYLETFLSMLLVSVSATTLLERFSGEIARGMRARKGNLILVAILAVFYAVVVNFLFGTPLSTAILTLGPHFALLRGEKVTVEGGQGGFFPTLHAAAIVGGSMVYCMILCKVVAALAVPWVVLRSVESQRRRDAAERGGDEERARLVGDVEEGGVAEEGGGEEAEAAGGEDGTEGAVERGVSKWRKVSFELLDLTCQVMEGLLAVPLWYTYLSFDSSSLAVTALGLWSPFRMAFAWSYLGLKAAALLLLLRRLFLVLHSCFFPALSWRRRLSPEDLLSRAQSNETDPICPICQSAPIRPVALRPCDHIFCEDCIAEWVERSGNCPTCRAQLEDDAPALIYGDGRGTFVLTVAW